MATKDTVPGLLSKVAKFVRNPTKDWSELDEVGANPESTYDKQALKEMIERKRQNDFIRRREFDQLRKLRRREGGAGGSMTRSSAFQSSVSTDPDGRAVTLKKIDEIEAQMSKQWWKGKLDPAHGAFAPTAPQSHEPAQEGSAEQSTQPASSNSQQFKVSGGSGFDFHAAEQAETQVGAAYRQAADTQPLGGEKAARPDGAQIGFSTSELFAYEDDQMATDPELEEAAIRYANGDDSGAEASLLQALRTPAIMPDMALSWAAALLDLYRATEQRAKFDDAVAEFAVRLGGHSPVWAHLPDSEPSTGGGHSRASGDTQPGGGSAHGANEPIWQAPEELSAEAMEVLREAMGSTPMPWYLDWAPLKRIAPEAMPLMGGLFASLCNEPVVLQFGGVESLVQTMRRMMPSGDRSVDQAWWDVRLDALRTMQMVDEFELVALDYCVTFEVSPPGWVPAHCQFENLSGAKPTAFASTTPAPFDASTSPAETTILGVQNGKTLELVGDVLGDATALLAADGRGYGSGEHIIVSCAQLRRVDFSAAGSILNWVAMRQAEGCQVQFRDVHRLVAAFFNVIGVHEHARVVLKAV
jgi:ABC-type transporter Mla MlaB component